jgi:hypothetical protein
VEGGGLGILDWETPQGAGLRRLYRSTSLNAWHGRRLIRHLLDRLHGYPGFMELNIHSLWSLIRIQTVHENA